ncbi:MAG TPA: long-chain fatty acid--CoA ligase [Hyphomicrobiaceae bacterium]|nr:long-chain fatty acid--CoA ligase [Hyphomicrobiaceae bacterium]
MTIQAQATVSSDRPAPAQKIVNRISMNADLNELPVLLDGADTMVKLFQRRCASYGATRIAHREKNLGIWRSFTWEDYWSHARLVGLGLMALGLKRGDVVSLLSEDRKEWLYCDMGLQSVGGVACGVYTTDSATQLAYIVNDSASRFLIVENDEQLDKFLTVRKDMPGIDKVIVIEREGLHDFSDPSVIFLEDLYALGSDYLAKHPAIFETEIAKSAPDEVAVLIYTSGTTGPPKGAMLTHANIMCVVASIAQAYEIGEMDEQICYLPLCHVYERLNSAWTPICTGAIVNFAESPETVFDNVREVAPHLFAAVPRVYEKIYSRIAIMNSEATGLGKLAYKMALGAGLKKVNRQLEGKGPSPLNSLNYAIWDFAVLRNLRRMLGLHRVRRATSGAAPISPELLKWYMAIGVPVLEAYGQTEGSALATANRPDAIKLGSVGKSMEGLDLRIAPDGEIQIKSGAVFKGYLGKPEKTAETLTADGYLRTGDVGSIDENGFVTITGRIKDIIITAGGKNITPAEIENRLKFSPYISDAVVIGDRRQYLTVLIMIDQENVEKFAQDRRVPFSDFASLCAAEPVKELIRGIVEDVNKEFARVEQIKDFRIIDQLLTAEDDELTPTMKLKRSFVEKKYKPLIEQMYRGG